MAGAPVVDAAEGIVVTELSDRATATLGGFTVAARRNTHYDFAPGSALDRKYKSLSYRFDLAGRSIVYTGDTGPSPAVAALAKGADLLISEMVDPDRTMAAVRRLAAGSPLPDRLEQHIRTHHLTPEDVGDLAARAGVKAVAITHLAAPGATPDDLEAYRARIGRRYSGPVIIGEDLSSF